jgi:hypothetical protein
VIARAAELPPIRPAGFTDTAGNPHEGAIGALADAGIIFGYEDGSFRPYQPITREHVAVVIGRWLGVEPVVSGPFVDVNRYAGQINALWELGIVAGTTETTFSPLRNIRRDQTASLVYRSLLAMDRDTDFLLTILHINDGESALLPDPRGFPVPFPGAARFVADLTAHQAVAATPPFEEYQPDLGVVTSRPATTTWRAHGSTHPSRTTTSSTTRSSTPRGLRRDDDRQPRVRLRSGPARRLHRGDG